MILYQTFDRDFAAIQTLVGSQFLANSTVQLLSQRISTSIKRIIVEYPYVDKDYRDTYYNDFSKRHALFDRNCVRLHLFTNEFTNINEDLTPETYQVFQEGFKGFLILRDTKVFTIGRSYLDPQIINDRAQGFFCLDNATVHIRGFNFKVKAFPWMQQDGNITRCAHVALWGIIRYFSDRYSFYPERTLHQITALLESEQRKNPSVGMTIEQIAQVLRDSYFHPGVYFRSAMKNATFDRLLYIMIESGLPFVAALTEGIGEGHAVAIIGHGKVIEAVAALKGKTGIIDSSELIEYLIASDDNHLPYTRIERSSSHALNRNGHTYGFDNIGAAVVPFYEKMFLDICAIFGGNRYQGCLQMIEKSYINLPPNTAIVRRVLLTSSKSYKNFIANNCLDATMRNVMLLLEMPKFVWLVEYSLPEEYDLGEIGWFIILDATAMNYQQGIFIAVQNRDSLIINQRDNSGSRPMVRLERGTGIRYTNNLESR